MKKLLLVACVFVSSTVAFAQLSGTYTINSGGGANYTSLSAAVTDLNTQGVSGPVVFNVTSVATTYVGQMIINNVTGASSTNTVTFNGNGNTVQFASTNSQQRAVIKLNGASWITINDFIINAAPGGQFYGYGVQLLGENADNNVISNNTVNTSKTISSSSYGGISITSCATSQTCTNNTGDFNLIINNLIIGGYYGITNMGGTSTAQRGMGIRLLETPLRISTRWAFTFMVKMAFLSAAMI